MPAKDHMHIYHAVGKDRIQFMCIDSDCSHTQVRNLLIGKRAKCVCGSEYKLDYYALTRKVPKCYVCRREKRSKGRVVKPSVMKDILGV